MDAETKELILESRKTTLEWEVWKGESDSAYLVSFMKGLDSLNLSSEERFQVLMKKIEYLRDIEITNINADASVIMSGVSRGVEDDFSEEEEPSGTQL